MPRKKKRTMPLEQRNPVNFYLSLLVDVGVSYQRALGEDVAKNFFAQHPVPGAIIARVLQGQQVRDLAAREKEAAQGAEPGLGMSGKSEVRERRERRQK